MKKTFLFLFVFFMILTVHSRADHLNTNSSNQCIYDLSPYQGHKGWCYIKRSNDRSYCSSKLKFSDLIDGYYLDGGECKLKNDLKISNLTQSQFDYQLALLANFAGLTMLFLISYLSTIIGRK